MDRHQHPSNNAVLRAPPGVSHDECVSLPITRVQFPDGAPGIISFWQPTPAEQALIAAGRPVRLVVIGSTHPPVSLGVDGDGEVL